MSKFTFTLANGEVFNVTAPDGVSESQVRAIFDKQYTTGSLTGLSIGDQVNAVTQAQSGLASAFPELTVDELKTLQKNKLKIPDLSNYSVVDGITTADFVNQGTVNAPVGSLSASTLQGLMAQLAVSTGQTPSDITEISGLGKFGFSANQLESVGLIKPGVADQINASPGTFVSTLSSSSVWTGKNGVNSLGSVLGNEKLQNSIQHDLYTDSFVKLKQLGTINGNELETQLAPVVQNASKFGVEVADSWLKGTAPTAQLVTLDQYAKNADFATMFSSISTPGGVNSLLNQSNLGGLLSTNPTAISTAVNSVAGQLLTDSGVGKLLGGSNITQNLGVDKLITGGGIGGSTLAVLQNTPVAAAAQKVISSLSGVFGGLFGGLFGGGGGSPLVAGITQVKNVNKTVNRTTVDRAVTAIIGNSKIPPPDFYV